MRKVILATPTYDHSVDVYYHHSVIETIKVCAENGIDVRPLSWPGEALVQHARNALSSVVVADHSVSDVFWVDSDQEWLPEQFMRLLSHPVDVVAAAYRKKTDDREQYTVRASTIEILPNGLWKVDSVGTGFLRVSRKAMQAAWEQSDPYQHSDGTNHRMVFDVGVVDGRLWGEDTIFCARLATCGFPIHVDPTFTVGHNGYKRYKGDFGEYIAKLKVKD